MHVRRVRGPRDRAGLGTRRRRRAAATRGRRSRPGSQLRPGPRRQPHRLGSRRTTGARNASAPTSPAGGSEYLLATKCGEHNREPDTYYDFSYDAIRRSIDESLGKLRTDVIDLMQIHFGPDPRKVLDDGETVAAMKDARAEGKIRFLGASTGGEIALRCIASGDFDVLQLEYSLTNRGDEPIVRLCGERGIGVLVRGGLAYGRLTARVIPHLESLNERERAGTKALLDLAGGDGRKLTALALQFLYRNPHVSSVLAGTRRAEHMKANLELVDLDLGAGVLEEAVRITSPASQFP